MFVRRRFTGNLLLNVECVVWKTRAETCLLSAVRECTVHVSAIILVTLLHSALYCH